MQHHISAEQKNPFRTVAKNLKTPTVEVGVKLFLRNRQKYIQRCKKVAVQKAVCFLCLELQDMASTLQQFYAGPVIFITGGNGFLGKQLLQSYPDIGSIIMCLRSVDRNCLTSVELSVACFSLPVLLRILPQITHGPFTNTPTWSDETNTTNKCNNTTKSTPKVTGGSKQAPVTFHLQY
jgi:hypothetical protein